MKRPGLCCLYSHNWRLSQSSWSSQLSGKRITDKWRFVSGTEPLSIYSSYIQVTNICLKYYLAKIKLNYSFSFFFFDILFSAMCMYVGLKFEWYHTQVSLGDSGVQRRVKSPWVRVSGTLELNKFDTRKWTWILGNIMKHSYLLSHLSSHINLLFPHTTLISEANIPCWRRQCMNMMRK